MSRPLLALGWLAVTGAAAAQVPDTVRTDTVDLRPLTVTGALWGPRRRGGLRRQPRGRRAGIEIVLASSA